MTSLARLLFVTIFTFLLGCGGGGGGGSSLNEVVINDMLGKWNGRVDLSANYCQRQIPDEFLTIHFVHNVFKGAESSDTVSVILEDGDRTCLAAGVKKDEDNFQAVCPEIVLPGFIEGYECREELVWDYTVFDSSGTAETNPVKRTSYIRCYEGNSLSFVCSVVYDGLAGRCVRNLC